MPHCAHHRNGRFPGKADMQFLLPGNKSESEPSSLRTHFFLRFLLHIEKQTRHCNLFAMTSLHQFLSNQHCRQVNHLPQIKSPRLQRLSKPVPESNVPIDSSLIIRFFPQVLDWVFYPWLLGSCHNLLRHMVGVLFLYNYKNQSNEQDGN